MTLVVFWSAVALLGWIYEYNHHRTDTAIGNKPPSPG